MFEFWKSKANILNFNMRFDYVISTDISLSNNGLLYLTGRSRNAQKYTKRQEILRYRMNLFLRGARIS
jgi:hypothetical protein